MALNSQITLPQAPHKDYIFCMISLSRVKNAILFCLALSCSLLAQEGSLGNEQVQPARIPLFSNLLHNMGWNALGAALYGYGVPWIVAAGGTYGFIESGVDWEWNRFCVRHETMSMVGSLPGGIVGTFAPFVVPLVLYYGSDDNEVQLTGLALGQAAFLGFAYTSVIKAFTGRIPPHVMDAADGDADYQEDYSDGFRFGFWRGGIINGWPSGHTATAVAMATTLATLYPDNNWIFAGSIAYSIMIGVSMSFVAHWSSDIFAGAITGFAIGRTVGKSYRSYRDGAMQDKVAFYAMPGGAGIVVRF